MRLTKLDCYTFRGARAAREVSSFLAVTPLVPSHTKHNISSAGRFVFAGSAAAREGMGSQVAFRLALDYFLAGVTEHCSKVRDPAHITQDDSAVELLHEAFRSANSSVYSFGHKLAAGGRLAASLVGLVVDDGKIAAGRTGIGSVYLFREGSLLPFFDTPESSEKIGDASEVPDPGSAKYLSYIGANSVVDVEVASVDIEPGDIACVFSRPLTNLNETLLLECLEAFGFDKVFENPTSSRRMDVASLLCKEVFTEPDTISFALVLRVGPAAIFCDQVVI